MQENAGFKQQTNTTPATYFLTGSIALGFRNPPANGAAFLSFFGFFCSLLLRCWPLAMVILLAALGCGLTTNA
jgi:hypothetical protein